MPRPDPIPKATRLFEATLYGTDLVALERFYTEVCGLEVVSQMSQRGLALRCGATALLLFDPDRTRIDGGRLPVHGCEGAGHVAFLTDEADLPAWRAHLARSGVAIEREVEWPEGGRSIYFRDPAGNSVELAPPTLWGGLGLER
jgi:catechol-2,3-dioxygenase